MLACLSPLGVRAGGAADWFAKHGKGKLEYKLFWHEGARPQDARKRRSEYRLQLELDIPITDSVRLFVAPDLRWDSHHTSAGTFDELNRKEVRRPIFHFKEAYVEYHKGPWEVRLGEQIFAWGTADSYNPTDNLNPHDYVDLVDNEKIPVFALSTTYHISDFTSFQFVIVPLFTPSRFDGQESRWSFFPAAPPDLDFQRHLPGDNLGNIQFAARAKTSTCGWDLSLSYFDGFNDVGRPYLSYDAFGAPQTVHFDFDRIRVVGFDFATTWRDIGIHGEISHTWTQAHHDDSYLQYVFGIDYTFADIRPGQNLRLILEYAGERVTSYGHDRDGVPPTRLGRYLDGSLLARAVYEINESASVELKACANLRSSNNYYIQPSFTFDVNESLRLTAGLDIFVGSSDTFFGQFDQNDRFFLSVEYYF